MTIPTSNTLMLTEKAMEQDELLVRRLKNGDHEAFESLVEAYRPRIYATLYNLLGRYQEAEEAIWDVFSEIWKSIGRFKGESKLSTWIYSLTTHVAYHRRRKRGATAIPFEEIEPNVAAPSNLETDVLRHEESRLVEKGISALPESLRVPLVLHSIAGLDYEEISKVLKLPVGALKTRVWRAKLELKKVLEPWMNQPST